MKQLIQAVLELNEDLVIELVNKGIKEGEHPLTIIRQVQEGVNKVGKRYDQGKYFIADLIMSGLIFSEVLKYIQFQPEDSMVSNTKIVFATVERDIHDIGKNIAITYFKSKGTSPIDLGVDISPVTIINNISQHDSTALYLSGLMTSSYTAMKETVAQLTEKGLRNRVKVVVCGLVNEDVKNFVGADYWIKDVVESFDVYLEISRSFSNAEDAICE